MEIDVIEQKCSCIALLVSKMRVNTLGLLYSWARQFFYVQSDLLTVAATVDLLSSKERWVGDLFKYVKNVFEPLSSRRR